MRVLILIILSFLVFTPAQAEAAHPRFRLEILPFDCIFEIINDGSGQVIYLTPEECGKYLEPDHPEDDSSLDDAEIEDGRIRVPDSFFHDDSGATDEDDESEETVEDEPAETSEEEDPAIIDPDDESEPLSLIEPERRFGLGAFTLVVATLFTGAIYLIFAWRRRDQPEE